LGNERPRGASWCSTDIRPAILDAVRNIPKIDPALLDAVRNIPKIDPALLDAVRNIPKIDPALFKTAFRDFGRRESDEPRSRATDSTAATEMGESDQPDADSSEEQTGPDSTPEEP
jgi:hypothetical protein